MKKIVLLLLLTAVTLGCSKDNDNDSEGIKDEVLTGTVQGKPFTFKGGKAFNTTTFDDEPGISLNITNVIADCDDSIFDFELRISAVVPNRVGVFKDINIVDQDGDDIPFNNIDNTVEIIALSATEVKGKMKLNRAASSIAEESVFEGSFTLPICE
ncbi:hypothetical protein HZY62_02260 [Maribacter polysiphoniae]|uniref:Lipoprotein n=1 Tax=Maribacter polysiphoniae TaxID=429344 RepID=A0A316E6G5_9FLAO|nr:hypothetical protein [Maribacter polysiphoniae]MBD1259397.1 hypothetical protein [Maribacter polysiphoniae]PWK24959.1 hypothetical protein LX92_01327 [Maribacter polysiphoniae]